MVHLLEQRSPAATHLYLETDVLVIGGGSATTQGMQSSNNLPTDAQG
ncbi:MAG: hypothetical protein DSM106950_13905 [Stigonema ocellatum SAG 48.90 = DSM 106950]|nr:hypothetical protein [Stigonema ocellatum SAG 48.90 = DSM 106950]